jgi:spore maturation protein CgeB
MCAGQEMDCLPFACYPPLHRPQAVPAASRDVVFIGNRDAKRDAFIASLLQQPFRSTVVGNYFLKDALFWKKPWAFRPSVVNDAMGKIYARHRVSVNIHAGVVRAGTNMRSFECAAYGIPQVIEARPEIDQYFVPGEEIMLVQNADAMNASVAALLADETRCKAMADRARTRALRDHTYYHRIVTLLERHVPANILQETFKRVGNPNAIN